jgi:uncharacterized protein
MSQHVSVSSTPLSHFFQDHISDREILTDTPSSPHHLRYLRVQMMHILNSLGSTFATCACGAKAKDCALEVMERFVDGDVGGPDAMKGVVEPGKKNKIDLGPLVGVTRGFGTREKVPFGGGYVGMEMVNGDESESVAEFSGTDHEEDGGLDTPPPREIPTISFTSPTPSPQKGGSKGKNRAVDEDLDESMYSRTSSSSLARECSVLSPGLRPEFVANASADSIAM